MDIEMKKDVTLYLTLDLDELVTLRDMLTLVRRDILNKLPSGPTMEQEHIINWIEDAHTKALR